MFNELLKNVMNLGIITEDDVKRLTAIELMMLIIERTNGLLNHVEIIDVKLANLLENIRTTTIEELNKWTQDGTFDELINQTALKEVNERLDEVEIDKVSKSYIYIDDFKEPEDIDDTASIQRAIDYSVSQPQIPIIIFSQKKYITSSPIILRSKVVLCGGYANDEYKAKAVIKNVTSDIFKVEETSVIGYNLLSLCFEGNDNNKLFETQPYEVYFHKWGKIQKCGFKHFKEVFGEIQFVGFRLYDLFINNVDHIGTIYGSDNYLQQWFVSHNGCGECYQNSLVIKSPLTVIRDIFWTGHLVTGRGPKSLLNIFGSNTYGVRVESCTFDYCNSYAIRVDVNARHVVIANNTFRGTNRVDTDRAIIEFHTSKNVSVYGNSFEHVHQGVENLTPIFYSFSGFEAHPAKDIVIYQNHYEQDYEFNVKMDYKCAKNVKIYENQFPYDNRAILTQTENFDGMNVDGIDVINSNVTSDFELTSLTGNPHQGKVLEIYNFASENTITVVQGLFKNKIPGNKVIERQSCARYIYHVNRWWEM